MGEILAHVSALAGASAPTAGGQGFGLSFRLSNRRARDVLRWRPCYPDYRAGLAG